MRQIFPIMLKHDKNIGFIMQIIKSYLGEVFVKKIDIVTNLAN